MLTYKEQEKLQALLTLIGDPEEEQQKRNSSIDVSNRSRDELGRFVQEEESESEYLREIVLVKVRGTYGTYLVRDKVTWKDRAYILVILGVIFILGKFL